MLRRICLVALIAATAAFPTAAIAVEPALSTGGSVLVPVGECDGTAPIKVECSFHGSMPAYVTAHLEAQAEFTGRIGVRLVTSTGSYNASCDFVGIQDPVCRSSTSGTLLIGQTFNAYGTASTPAPMDGSTIQRVAAGRWRVYLTSP